MNRIRISLACLALVAGCMATASAATNSLTVKLSAQNGSGENGTAVLTQGSDGVMVVVTIPGGPAGPQPAHIHSGTCANLGAVVYPLTNVASGNSKTTVKGTTIDKLLAGKFAINVHKSTSDLGTYVSCGNIVMPSSM